MTIRVFSRAEQSRAEHRSWGWQSTRRVIGRGVFLPFPRVKGVSVYLIHKHLPWSFLSELNDVPFTCRSTVVSACLPAYVLGKESKSRWRGLSAARTEANGKQS